MSARKPRFRVDQVVMELDHAATDWKRKVDFRLVKIVSFKELEDGCIDYEVWPPAVRMLTAPWLRPLTSREIGPRTKGGRR